MFDINIDNANDFIKNILHEKTQVNNGTFHLSAGNIYEITSTGELDFGGSEFKQSDLNKIKPEKKSEDDKYGWWFLDKGTYIVKFNENLAKNKLKNYSFIISPLKRLIECGAIHETKIITNNIDLKIVLKVAEKGVNIKENSRISKLTILENK